MARLPVRLRTLLTAATTTALLAAAPAHAGVYGDELTKCLVRSTAQEDRTQLAQWMFAVMSLHPEVSRNANFTDAQRLEINKNAAALFERLLTRACVAEAREAINYEGAAAFQSSFQTLGQVAARELLSNPRVNAGVAELSRYLDNKKLEATLGTAK